MVSLCFDMTRRVNVIQVDAWPKQQPESHVRIALQHTCCIFLLAPYEIKPGGSSGLIVAEGTRESACKTIRMNTAHDPKPETLNPKSLKVLLEFRV